MRGQRFFFLLCFFITSSAHAIQWMDRSSTIFFPNALKTQIQASQSFPVFWWNFLIFDQVGPGDTARWTKIKNICAELKTHSKEEVLRVECESSPAEFAALVKDWAHDLPLRIDQPKTEASLEHFNQVLSQASLVPGSSSLMQVLRLDPFESWKELKGLAEKRIPLPFPRLNGYFYDLQTSRVLIPIQFAFPPTETKKTKVLINFSDGNLIGAHGSSLENETRIMTDLHGVSLIGFFILAAFSVVLALLGAIRVVPLFAVILAGTGIGFLLTFLVFGSVHGLTLSFGSAIIGLGMDYAFQAALNAKEPGIWKSNLCGLSTTLIGLVILMFSSVPLLRQMMFFSTTGLISSFLLCYFIFKKWPGRFEVTSIHYHPKMNVFKKFSTLGLLALALLGLFTFEPKLDLKQFNFEKTKNHELSTWLYQSLETKSPLFSIHKTSAALLESTREKSWAESHELALETLANYLPDAQTQNAHLKTWKSWPDFQKHLNENQTRFFAPFLSEIAFKAYTLENPVRAYLNHLNHEDEWITLWLPKTSEQEKEIRREFKDTTSLSEIVSVFPKTLAHELEWMGPLSMLLAAFFHFIYYRRISYSLIALLPFFTGFGLVTLARLLLHFELSFISIMGLILVFGFSLDYGIFATDACLHPERKGMWPGILLAAFSTIAGFVPLVFCQHPVLKDLGLTLFFGGVGTLVGSLYTIPTVIKWVRLKEMESAN
jgi:hypothetical protein